MGNEIKQEDIIKSVLSALAQEGIYFATKDDCMYSNAKNLYKLDTSGKLEDKTIARISKEVLDYLGDGAVFLNEAVEQWVYDNLLEGRLGYIDCLSMNYNAEQVLEDITAYDNQGMNDLELGTLDEKGKEKKLESKLVESSDDDRINDLLEKSQEELQSDYNYVRGWKTCNDIDVQGIFGNYAYQYLDDEYESDGTKEYLSWIKKIYLNAIKKAAEKNGYTLDKSALPKKATIKDYINELLDDETVQKGISTLRELFFGTGRIIANDASNYEYDNTNECSELDRLLKISRDIVPSTIKWNIITGLMGSRLNNRKELNSDSIVFFSKKFGSEYDENKQKEYADIYVEVLREIGKSNINVQEILSYMRPEKFKKSESKKIVENADDYNTEEEIKNRLKEINKQLAYIRRRDAVSLAIGTEDEQSELYSERNKLNGKLKKIRNKKVDIKSMTPEEQETFKNKLKELELWDGTEENLPSAIQLYRAYHMNESKKIIEGMFDVGPEITEDELQIGDLYIDRSKYLNKVLDRPMADGDLGVLGKQLTKMFMPNQQNLKGTQWEVEKIRYATDDDMQKYPHIVNSKKKVTEATSTISLNKIKQELENKAIKVMQSKFGFEDDAKDYLNVEVRKDKSAKKGIIVIVSAELDYDDLMKLSEELDTVINKYDKDAYLDAVTSGVLQTGLLVKGKITEDYDDYGIDYSDGSTWEDGDFFEVSNGDETVKIIKRGGKWEDNVGNKFMGYLSPKDIMQYFRGYKIVENKKIVESKQSEDIYNNLSRALTDYENKDADVSDLYGMLVDIQNSWELITSSNTESKTLYNKLSKILTDYEEGNADKNDLYEMLVDIQNRWEDTLTTNLEESRTHMQLQKGDKFINDNGVVAEIVNVDKEHLLDGEPQVTRKLGDKDIKCYKMSSVVDMLNQNGYKKMEEKKTLREGKRQRLEEENSKSKDLINSMVTAKDFDSDSPKGQIILRTQELFNVLSDRGYDVQVTFDNGESQSIISMGNQGGSIIITITNNNQPLRAFTNGNFELIDDNIKILNDIQEQISVL